MSGMKTPSRFLDWKFQLETHADHEHVQQAYHHDHAEVNNGVSSSSSIQSNNSNVNVDVNDKNGYNFELLVT